MSRGTETPGTILLIIDACQSGQALETDEHRRGPMNSRGLAQLAYEKGMYILAASQSDEAAVESSNLGHGLLTYVLVEEGLKTLAADGPPADGRIEVREWLDYATLAEWDRSCLVAQRLLITVDNRFLDRGL